MLVVTDQGSYGLLNYGRLCGAGGGGGAPSTPTAGWERGGAKAAGRYFRLPAGDDLAHFSNSRQAKLTRISNFQDCPLNSIVVNDF